jgi:hypothetical protein
LERGAVLAKILYNPLVYWNWRGANITIKTRLDREEIARTLSAGLILLTIFSLALYYSLVTSQQSNGAIRLIIRKPSELPKGVEGELDVEAVNKEGLVDPSRNDLVNISLIGNSYAKVGFSDRTGTIWSRTLMMRLEAGKVQFKFVDSQMERIQVSVE